MRRCAENSLDYQDGGTRGVKCPEWAPDVCSDSIVAPSDSCQAGIVPG